MKAEQLRQELKHKKQWDELRAKNEAALKELEQLQVDSLMIFGWLREMDNEIISINRQDFLYSVIYTTH